MEQVNRYAAVDLFIPNSVHTHIDSFVERGDSEGSRPFRRQIDFWWAGMLIGARLKEEIPLVGEGGQTKFGTGVILNSDPWRITQLELLALGEAGIEVFTSPSRVVGIVQVCANRGMTWLLETLLGEADATLSLTNEVVSFM
jgi:hypothetical protein